MLGSLLASLQQAGCCRWRGSEWDLNSQEGTEQAKRPLHPVVLSCGQGRALACGMWKGKVGLSGATSGAA